MTDEHYQCFEEAKKQRSNGNFTDAGNCYTLAACESLSSGQATIRPLEDGQVDTSRGLCNLLSAVVCYRLGDEIGRAKNRAEQGVLVATDIREYVVAHEPQRGLMEEYIGDFRLLSGQEGFDDAYQAAQAVYAETENHIGWQAEPEFELNMTVFLELARAANHSIGREKEESIRAESLVERIKYKQEYFPAILKEVIIAGSW